MKKFFAALKSLFVAPPPPPPPPTPPQQPRELSLEDIRRQIFETRRNMEIRNREACSAEAEAEAAIQKTFQPGLSQPERKKLIAKHQNGIQKAKRLAGFALQLGTLLDSLENTEAYMELAESMARSNVAGAGNFSVSDLMQELQEMQAALLPMLQALSQLKTNMDISAEQFDRDLAPDAATTASQNELMALYAKFDAETDPVKKAAIRVEIESLQKSKVALGPFAV